MAFSINAINLMYSFNSPLSGYPFSFAGWFRVPDVSLLIPLAGLVNFSAGQDSGIYFAGDAGKEVVAKTTNGSSESAHSTSPMTPGKWHHVAGVFASDNDRKIYLDGSNVGVNSTSLSLGALNFLYFGPLGETTSIGIANVSIFEAALSEEQVALLAQGFSVFTLSRARDVLTHQDCIRDINRPGSGLEISLAGPLAIVDHPRMTFPNSNYSMTMPDRVRGPFRIEETLFRSQSAEQGQISSAGVVSTSEVLSGEVSS